MRVVRGVFRPRLGSWQSRGPVEADGEIVREREPGREPFLAAVAAQPAEAERVVGERLAAGHATIAP
jgi:hypothetical protein